MEYSNLVPKQINKKKKTDQNTKAVLRQCGYPDWAFKTAEKKMQEEMTKKKKVEKNKNPESTSCRLVVLPYVKGLSETTARIMMKYERTCAFKPGNTLGQQLFRLKDKSDPIEMEDVIYKAQYKDCQGSYIEETT